MGSRRSLIDRNASQSSTSLNSSTPGHPESTEFDRHRRHMNSNIRGPVNPGHEDSEEYSRYPVYVPGKKPETARYDRITCKPTDLNWNYCDDFFGMCLKPCPKPNARDLTRRTREAGRSFYDEQERLFNQGLYNPDNIDQTYSNQSVGSRPTSSNIDQNRYDNEQYDQSGGNEPSPRNTNNQNVSSARSQGKNFPGASRQRGL